ncbi:MAG TPA: hypothetical protein VN956_05345 [Pyrinomonadaceae bacterium]|nr:hypothetical protein [Pyrinomonadaceae bacterium]
MLRAQKFFQLLLLAYPAEFRREYGTQMTQLFRDCYRAEEHRPGRFWLSTISDLIRAAPREHLERLEKENSIMKNLRRDALALIGSLAIIVVAFLLLSYGRKHGVSSIIMFGYVLDALVMAGILGNIIVFLLVKTTKFDPVRTALWTFLIISAAPVLLIALTVGRSDPQFRLGSVVIGNVLSSLFWFALHWMWAKSKGQLAVSE